MMVINDMIEKTEHETLIVDLLNGDRKKLLSVLKLQKLSIILTKSLSMHLVNIAPTSSEAKSIKT